MQIRNIHHCGYIFTIFTRKLNCFLCVFSQDAYMYLYVKIIYFFDLMFLW
ncbi:hypothetical protein CCP2SC5_860002 [Azospirillaceae bacterium]